MEPTQKISRKKKALFIVIVIVIVMVSIELTLHLVDWIRGYPDDIRIGFDMFKGDDWARDFFRESNEFGKAGSSYAHYVEWTINPFHGKFYNVNDDGTRHTWNPTSTSKLPLVYVLGGSVAFSAGARDEYTIPSYLSKALNEKTPRAIVENRAQPGYIATQELVQLTLLLREGKRPDYVIFLDGYNDVAAAYDLGKAGAFTAEGIVRQRLESSPLGMVAFAGKVFIRDNCKICRGIIDIGRAISLGNFRLATIHGLDSDDAKLRLLAQNVADEYLKNLGLLDELSKTYHFKYMAFLQPSLLADTVLVGDEARLKEIDWRLNAKSMYAFYRYSTDDVAKTTSTQFTNLSHALEGRTKALFIDSAHLSEDGNAIVAGKMFDILEKKSFFK